MYFNDNIQEIQVLSLKKKFKKFVRSFTTNVFKKIGIYDYYLFLTHT